MRLLIRTPDDLRRVVVLYFYELGDEITVRVLTEHGEEADLATFTSAEISEALYGR